MVEELTNFIVIGSIFVYNKKEYKWKRAWNDERDGTVLYTRAIAQGHEA